MHEAQFGQATAAGHWLGAAERYDAMACQMDPGRPLGPGRTAPGGQAQPQGDQRDASQSDAATAARPAVRLARRKSRFIRVMVSILIILGQASWHSP